MWRTVSSLCLALGLWVLLSASLCTEYEFKNPNDPLSPNFVSPPPNHAPEFTSDSASMTRLATVGNEYTENILVDEPDGDPVFLRLLESPTSMALAGDSISWLPDNADTAAVVVVVQASDDLGASDTLSWVILVQPATNDAPQFTSDSSAMVSWVIVDNDYLATIHVSDPDSHSLTLVLLDNPVGMTIIDSVVTWTPENADTGIVNISLQAVDLYGAADTMSWAVEVLGPGSWSAADSMSTPRSGHKTVALHDKIYCFGGSSSGVWTNTLEEYDPASGQWTAKASPEAFFSASVACTLNGKLYAIGKKFADTLSVRVYDPHSDQWTVESDTLLNVYGLSGGASISGKVYWAAYESGAMMTYSLYVYESATTQWTVGDAIPFVPASSCIVALQEKVYFVPLGYGTIQTYDPATASWATASTATFSVRYSPAITTYQEQIYVVGGYSTMGMTMVYPGLSIVEAYDPTANRWNVLASMPTPRHNLGAACVNGKLYAIGGQDSTNYLATVEAFTPP